MSLKQEDILRILDVHFLGNYFQRRINPYFPPYVLVKMNSTVLGHADERDISLRETVLLTEMYLIDLDRKGEIIYYI